MESDIADPLHPIIENSKYFLRLPLNQNDLILFLEEYFAIVSSTAQHNASGTECKLLCGNDMKVIVTAKGLRTSISFLS